MNKEEQILIKDEKGQVLLTIKFDGPFVPEKKFSAELFPKTKEELVISKSLNFTFECTFDTKDIDMAPLATLAVYVMAYPKNLKLMAQRLKENFVLGALVDAGKLTNQTPVEHPHKRLPSDKPCEQKIALLVTGDCSWWPGEGLIMAEADRDMKALGYVTQSLMQPTINAFETALANPCVKALVIIGHGIGADSPVNAQRNARVALVGDGKNGLQPRHLTALGVPNVPLDLFILHACFQGSPNNAKAWKASAGGKKTVFLSWNSSASPFEVYTWQKFF